MDFEEEEKQFKMQKLQIDMQNGLHVFYPAELLPQWMASWIQALQRDKYSVVKKKIAQPKENNDRGETHKMFLLRYCLVSFCCYDSLIVGGRAAKGNGKGQLNLTLYFIAKLPE